MPPATRGEATNLNIGGLERTIAAKAVTYDFARLVENEPNCSGTFVRL